MKVQKVPQCGKQNSVFARDFIFCVMRVPSDMEKKKKTS